MMLMLRVIIFASFFHNKELGRRKYDSQVEEKHNKNGRAIFKSNYFYSLFFSGYSILLYSSSFYYKGGRGDYVIFA